MALLYKIFVGFRHRSQLMWARLLTWQFGIFAIQPFAQLLPIDGRDFEVIKRYTVEGLAQSLNGGFGISPPTLTGGLHPKQV